MSLEKSKPVKGLDIKNFSLILKGKKHWKKQQNKSNYIREDTRKRQLTWFRNRLDAQWFDLISEPNQKSQIEQTIKKWLEAE